MKATKNQTPPPVPRMDDYIPIQELSFIKGAIKDWKGPLVDSARIGINQYFKAVDNYLNHCKSMESTTVQKAA